MIYTTKTLKELARIPYKYREEYLGFIVDGVIVSPLRCPECGSELIVLDSSSEYAQCIGCNKAFSIHYYTDFRIPYAKEVFGKFIRGRFVEDDV